MTAVLPVPAATPVVPAIRPVTLTEPVPGFPSHRDYVLVAADASGLLRWLQALDPEGPRFLVVPPAPFVPEYAPRLPGAVLTELDLDSPAAAELLCVVTVPDGDVRAATVNLRAPLVLNPATARGRQVVLADAGHPFRHPLRR
jgi:flagellar assembly factor FliW